MACPLQRCCPWDRGPWPCRMYPVGFAAPQEDSGEAPFYFLLEEEG